MPGQQKISSNLSSSSNSRLVEFGVSVDGLASRVHLEHSAILNWARLTDGQENKSEAIKSLLQAIDFQGRLTKDVPQWMTHTSSDKYYILFENEPELVLEIKASERRDRDWVAKNIKAPKSRRKQAKEVDFQKGKIIDQDSLARLNNGDLSQLLISVHADEQAFARAGIKDLRSTLERSDWRLKETPLWANGARGINSWSLLVPFKEDELALLLAQNDKQDLPVVVTTVISHQWAKEDLLDATPAQLAQRIKATSSLLAKLSLTQNAFKDEIKARGELVYEDALYLKIAQKRIVIYPNCYQNWIANKLA